MRPVGRAERVVHIHVRIGCERLRECRIVLLLFRVEAEILEQEHLARLEPADCILGPLPQRVAGAGDIDAQELR